MSDSDDTNVLLLIPPNFFIVESSCSGDSGSELSPRLNFRGASELDPLRTMSSMQPTSGSDLTSPSISTVKARQFNRFGCASIAENRQFTHSTPKSCSKNLLNEIDQFLLENERTIQKQSQTQLHSSPLIDLKDLYLSPEKVQAPSCYPCGNRLSLDPDDDASAPLISLVDLWSNEGSKVTSIQEERLRRQHCEKIIQTLQTRMLELQQKISVAVRVDRTKDDALSKFHATVSKLTEMIQHLETENKQIKEQNIAMKTEYANSILEERKKNERLQDELATALALAKDFQQKNEVLESKIENFTSSTIDVEDIHKKQIEDLEVRLLNSKQHELQFNEKLESEIRKAVKMKEDWDKDRKNLEQANYQNENAFRRLKDVQNRLHDVDKQKQLAQQAVETFESKERILVKDLETQRASLKSYYQNQLEQVVRAKLKEFQQQIDSVERTLREDARHRERTIAERALQQMEIVNTKHNEELTLLHQKHAEENSLYRLQLATSLRTIDDLQAKLSVHQTRRANIAEQLHNMMETQWQKAIEILTNNTEEDPLAMVANHNDRPRKSSIKHEYNNCAEENRSENEIFETPRSSRNRKLHEKSEDRLQSYIEMLLKMSPKELDLLRGPNEDKSATTVSKTEALNSVKPKPWK